MSKYIDAEKLRKAIEDKGLDCSFALKMERLDTLALIDELQQEQQERTCKTCGFYENNCPFIRGKLIPYPNKVCKDYTYSAVKAQEQPESFSCGHENGSEPKPEGIEAVVHHYANVHYLVTNTEQLNARLKQFDNDARVLVYIEARKEE